MKLFVPTIGTILRLSQDWSFTLYNEGRNDALWEVFVKPMSSRWGGYKERKLDGDWNQEYKSEEVTLPAGTVIVVDRVYIRQGNDKMKQFDSLSFRIQSCPNPKIKGRARFWAKLDDVNRMEVELEKPDEEPMIRGYMMLRPGVAPAKAIKELDGEKVTVVKSNKKFITIECPAKRYKSIFGQPLKVTKSGAEWERKKTRYRNMQVMCSQFVMFNEPTADLVEVDHNAVEVKVGQPFKVICPFVASERDPSWPDGYWYFKKSKELAYLDEGWVSANPTPSPFQNRYGSPMFYFVGTEPGTYSIKLENHKHDYATSPVNTQVEVKVTVLR